MENKNTKKMLELLDRAKEKVESGEIDALVISGCGDETGFRQLYGNNFAVIGLAKTLYDKALKENEKQENAVNFSDILSSLINED